MRWRDRENIMLTMSEMPLIARAKARGDRVAIIAEGRTFTYRDLLEASSRAAGCLLGGARDLCEARVAFLAPPGFDYAATQWGAWRAGGIAVPLSLSSPRPELEYVIADCGAKVVVAHPDLEAAVRPIAGARGLRLEIGRAHV